MQSREPLINSNQKISLLDNLREKKVYIILGLLTVVVLIGSVFFLSKGTKTVTVPDDQVVSKNGLHWHPKLSIKIKGKEQDIPANIGVGGSVHQKIHTHDQDAKDGVVHIEISGIATKDDLKLGNFFRIWGKDFSSTKILDKTNGAEGKVKMKVNGKENTQFENYEMKEGDNIEIFYE